jgi:hypothetical protein
MAAPAPEDRGHAVPTDDTTGTQPNSSDDIARRAYERFRARGEEHGHDQEDWFAAERELRDGSSRTSE